MSKEQDVASYAKELDADESQLVEVFFALAWKPIDGAVHIRELKVESRKLIDGAGILDQKSPFRISLGKHMRGTKIKVEWSLRSYDDLLGIGAFIRREPTADSKWELLPGKEKAPLGHQLPWSDSADVEVK